ncbi:MAG: mechanosensitive ion channel family protein [Spirochaetaceae bacterium]|nr:MAG: mechanosensitive ion channel family protein [Spirochaetaceae bacterium]
MTWSRLPIGASDRTTAGGSAATCYSSGSATTERAWEEYVRFLIPDEIIRLFTLDSALVLARILLVLLVSVLLVKLVAFFTVQLFKRRFSQQSLMILKKVITYSGVIIIWMIVLAQLGLNLAALLGAAGIAGIAVGFAAQTSVSNVISGMFLISEKSFAVGDVIRVGTFQGVVLTIDLLSVKIRTFDNQYIRLPNEMLIKSEVTNVTRFPIRRLNVEFVVRYGTDLMKLKEVLSEVARANSNCLDEPEPLFVITAFGRFGIEMLFGIWFVKEDFLAVRNSVMQGIHVAFNEAGIEFAVPAVAQLEAPT